MSDIRTSKMGKAPKSKLLLVRIWASSDFRSLGLKFDTKSVRNPNAFGSAFWALIVQNSNNLIQILDILCPDFGQLGLCPKTEWFCSFCSIIVWNSDASNGPNSELSRYSGMLKSERVQISDRRFVIGSNFCLGAITVCPKTERFCSDFGQKFLSEIRTNGPNRTIFVWFYT